MSRQTWADYGLRVSSNPLGITSWHWSPTDDLPGDSDDLYEPATGVGIAWRVGLGWALESTSEVLRPDYSAVDFAAASLSGDPPAGYAFMTLDNVDRVVYQYLGPSLKMNRQPPVEVVAKFLALDGQIREA